MHQALFKHLILLDWLDFPNTPMRQVLLYHMPTLWMRGPRHRAGKSAAPGHSKLNSLPSGNSEGAQRPPRYKDIKQLHTNSWLEVRQEDEGKSRETEG